VELGEQRVRWRDVDWTNDSILVAL